MGDISDSVAEILPADFGSNGVMPPVAILRRLAYDLGRKTRFTVEGDVRSKAKEPPHSHRIRHTFQLVAPGLDGLRYPLFHIEQDVADFYPLELIASAAAVGQKIEDYIHGEQEL